MLIHHPGMEISQVCIVKVDKHMNNIRLMLEGLDGSKVEKLLVNGVSKKATQIKLDKEVT